MGDLRPNRSKILVSVRNPHEAALAAANCDIVDLKEPANGPLGAVGHDVADTCMSVLPAETPVSLALGELVHNSADTHDFKHIAQFANKHNSRSIYVKMGLSQLDGDESWQGEWLSMMDLLPPSVKRVVVAYADNVAARSPDVMSLMRFAIEVKADAFLIDTYDKRGGHLFDHISEQQTDTIITTLGRAGVPVALAGSITVDLIETYCGRCPDIWAMRGAVCDGGRVGQLSVKKIEMIKTVIANHQSTDQPFKV